MFKIEDMYCGLDADGSCIFDAMFPNRDTRLMRISRVADLANIRYSTMCEDVRVWRDEENEPVTGVIKDHPRKSRHGGEEGRHPAGHDGPAPLHLEIEAELKGWCKLVNASGLIQMLRAPIGFGC
ncbi:hypothetical protein [Nocardia sp. NPDC059239]|uniref:hypothetical protein n=1 Tax=Nocardia sp. NPDC059239 TaxID=3346785 RepID=UPI003675467F